MSLNKVNKLLEGKFSILTLFKQFYFSEKIELFI